MTRKYLACVVFICLISINAYGTSMYPLSDYSSVLKNIEVLFQRNIQTDINNNLKSKEEKEIKSLLMNIWRENCGPTVDKNVPEMTISKLCLLYGHGKYIDFKVMCRI